MPDFEVTAVDIGILLAYVVLTWLLFGWYLARRTRGEVPESYFLAGRWPIIGLSFYVANMSGGSFIALPRSGYNDGTAQDPPRLRERRWHQDYRISSAARAAVSAAIVPWW